MAVAYNPQVIALMGQGLSYEQALQTVQQAQASQAGNGPLGSWGDWLAKNVPGALAGLGDAQQNAPQVADPLGMRTGAWNMLKSGGDMLGMRTALGNATGVAPAVSGAVSPTPAQASPLETGNNPPPQNGSTSAQTNPGPDNSGASANGSTRGDVSMGPAAPGENQSGDDATNKGPKQPPSAGGTDTGAAPSQAAANSAYPGAPAGARNEQRFGYDPASDSPGSWASRVFMEGMKDAGTNLYDPLLAGSPWGRFLSERYTPDLESRLLLGEMNGGVGAGNEASFAQGTLADMARGGGSPAGGGAFDALKNAATNLGAYANGGTFSDPSQTMALGRMANDPIAQSNTILGGLRGATGGFGMQYAQGALGDMQRQYQNDPSQYQPSGFMAAALAKLGVR